MADFALWATACETALWTTGTFWSAYCGNRAEAVEGVIDADPIVATVRTMMATRTEWTGTASDLLGALAEAASERDHLFEPTPLVFTQSADIFLYQNDPAKTGKM